MTATPTSVFGPERVPDGGWPQDQVVELRRDGTICDLTSSTSLTGGNLAGPTVIQESGGGGGQSDAVSLRSTSYYSRSRPRSEMLSNDEVDYDNNAQAARKTVGASGDHGSDGGAAAPSASFTNVVLKAEARLRDAAWEAMRETFEVLVDDVRSSLLFTSSQSFHLVCRETYRCAPCSRSLRRRS